MRIHFIFKDLLETPQVSKFEHENIFAATFRDELISKEPTSYGQQIGISSFDGSKNAPKKTLLSRTQSQNESEKQEALRNL